LNEIGGCRSENCSEASNHLLAGQDSAFPAQQEKVQHSTGMDEKDLSEWSVVNH